MVEPHRPPFDNSELRHAMALSLDRNAFIDIMSDGKGDIGGIMPPPEGLQGTPPGILTALRGYQPDVQGNRSEAGSCSSSAMQRTRACNGP
jgi:peptide/nickel transport system substrate-binding protein